MVEHLRNVYVLDWFADTHPDNLEQSTIHVKIPPELPDRENWHWSRGPVRQRLPGWKQRGYDIWKYYESKVRPHVTYQDFSRMFENGNAALLQNIKEQYDNYRESLIELYDDIKRLVNQESAASNPVAKRKARTRLTYVRTALFLFTNPHNRILTFRRVWKPVRDDDFVYFTTIGNMDKHDS